MEGPHYGNAAYELPEICELLPQVHSRIRRKSLPNAASDVQQRKKVRWNERAQEAFENIKWEFCKPPVLGMPTEKGLYFLDTESSVVVISGTLHQEQEWNEEQFSVLFHVTVRC